MSANKKIRVLPSFHKSLDADVKFVKENSEKINQVLTVMHGALCEVLNCPVSQSGALAMKAIAEIALCETQRISLTTGLGKFQTTGGQDG